MQLNILTRTNNNMIYVLFEINKIFESIQLTGLKIYHKEHKIERLNFVGKMIIQKSDRCIKIIQKTSTAKITNYTLGKTRK